MVTVHCTIESIPRMMMMQVVNFATCCCVLVSTQQATSTTTTPPVLVPPYIYFVVSAKNIAGAETDRDGLADPFVKVFLGTEPASGEKPTDATALNPIDVSETLENENNPVWNKVFKVSHTPGSKQLLFLEVRDHDPVNPDDAIGEAYIKLDDFVAKGEYTQVLEKAKSGSITVTRTSPIYFDIIVKDVPSKDEFGGLSDPYVKCYFRNGKDGKDFKFYQTDVVDNAETASWEHLAFENYRKGTNQFLHFRVKDQDTITGDDDLGEAFLELDPFLAAKKEVKFSLPDNATLSVVPNRDL
ncbi:Synaptotagmin-7 [Orchesella cincta]|uniref:Synaptotagmin-7 n=1 Tax=Orchesella cincta TaxID=48709 RepID=A0A1D2NGP4_ORCCI|nr:Synaptotagmin-7 [Orchesella cincta]